MMSTYELVIAFLSTTDSYIPSSTEVTTLRKQKVSLAHVDSEANAVNDSEY
jgi:hypothetical protein